MLKCNQLQHVLHHSNVLIFFFFAEVFFVNLVPGPLSFLCGEGLCNEVNSEARRKEIMFFLSLKILHDISKNTFSIWYIL